MSTVLNTNGEELQVPQIVEPSQFKCAIFTAEWNPAVTHALRDGAVDVLKRAGVSDSAIFQAEVPARWSWSMPPAWRSARCPISRR